MTQGKDARLFPVPTTPKRVQDGQPQGPERPTIPGCQRTAYFFSILARTRSLTHCLTPPLLCYGRQARRLSACQTACFFERFRLSAVPLWDMSRNIGQGFTPQSPSLYVSRNRAETYQDADPGALVDTVKLEHEIRITNRNA